MRSTTRRLLKIRLLSQSEVPPAALRLPPLSHQQAVKEKKAEAKASVAAKLGDTMSAGRDASWPGNLRIQAAEKKTLFWKVPKERRTQLKRILRES